MQNLKTLLELLLNNQFDFVLVGDFDRIKKDAIEIKIFGHTCKVISIEDLLTVKKSMKRPKDIETSKILEKIKNLKTNPSA